MRIVHGSFQRLPVVVVLVLLASLASVSPAQAAQPRPWSWFGAHVTGEPTVGGSLTCHRGVWTGAPTSYAYEWRRGTTVLGTGPEYTPVIADVLDYVGGQHRRVTCRVTATNASGSYPSSDDIAVRSAAGGPTPRSIPLLRGTLAVGEQLTCDAPQLRNPATSTTFAFTSATGGAAASSSATYTVRDGDVGSAITCTVRVENASGVASVRSESLPPTPASDSDGYSLAPSVHASLAGSGAVGEMLTCNPGTWPAGTSISYSWQVSYSQVATTSTYTPVIADQGKRISCEVRGVNGARTGTSYVQIDAVVAGAGIESNSVAPSITGTPAPGYSLTCDPGTWSGTPSGYEYAWARDIDSPVEWGSATSAVLSLSGGNATHYYGHRVRCAVRASNARGWSSWTYSSPVTISAPAGTPSNSVAPSISGTPTNGSTLTCDPGTWSDAAELSYRWLREDGSGFPGGRSSTLKLERYPVGGKLRCHVGAVNGDYGLTAASAPVTIGAATGTPAHDALPTITGSGVVGEPLTCHASSSSNARQYFSWYIDGFENAPGTLGYDVYHPTSAQVGRRIACGVNLQNDAGYADARSAEPGLLITAAAGPAPGEPVAPVVDPQPDPQVIAQPDPVVVVEPPADGGEDDTSTTPLPPKVAPAAPKPSAIRLTDSRSFRSIARGTVLTSLPVDQAGVTVRLSVTVTAVQARALGIKAPRRARAVVIGSGAARSTKAGRLLVRIKLTPAARSAFSRASVPTSTVRSARAVIAVSLTKSALTSKVTKPVTFVR